MSSYNATTLTLYRKARCNACTITGNHNQITGHRNNISGEGNTVQGNGPRTWERRPEECSIKRIDPWRPQATGKNFGLGNFNHSVRDPWQEVKPNLDQEAKKGEPEHLLCVICYQRTKNCMLDPCGHLSFCSTCIAQEKPANCPICRASINKAKTVYF